MGHCPCISYFEFKAQWNKADITFWACFVILESWNILQCHNSFADVQWMYESVRDFPTNGSFSFLVYVNFIPTCSCIWPMHCKFLTVMSSYRLGPDLFVSFTSFIFGNKLFSSFHHINVCYFSPQITIICVGGLYNLNTKVEVYI